MVATLPAALLLGLRLRLKSYARSLPVWGRQGLLRVEALSGDREVGMGKN